MHRLWESSRSLHCAVRGLVTSSSLGSIAAPAAASGAWRAALAARGASGRSLSHGASAAKLEVVAAGAESTTGSRVAHMSTVSSSSSSSSSNSSSSSSGSPAETGDPSATAGAAASSSGSSNISSSSSGGVTGSSSGDSASTSGGVEGAVGGPEGSRMDRLMRVLLHPISRSRRWTGQLNDQLVSVNGQLFAEPSAVLTSTLRALHVVRDVLKEVRRRRGWAEGLALALRGTECVQQLLGKHWACVPVLLCCAGVPTPPPPRAPGRPRVRVGDQPAAAPAAARGGALLHQPQHVVDGVVLVARHDIQRSVTQALVPASPPAQPQVRARAAWAGVRLTCLGRPASRAVPFRCRPRTQRAAAARAHRCGAAPCSPAATARFVSCPHQRLFMAKGLRMVNPHCPEPHTPPPRLDWSDKWALYARSNRPGYRQLLQDLVDREQAVHT